MIENKYLSWINYLISGISITTIAIIIIIGGINLYRWNMFLITIGLLVLSIFDCIKILKAQKYKKNIITRIISNLLLAGVITFLPKIALGFFPICFAIYLLINAVIKFISYMVLKQDNLNERYREFVLGLIFTIVAFIFLSSPVNSLSALIVIVGIYMIMIGMNYFRTFINELIPKKYKNKIKRKFHMALPAIFEAFIPLNVLNSINRYINNQDEEKLDFELKKDDVKPDLEIFIHVTNHGFNSFGHVDLLFDDEVISYGNYDKNTYRLKTTIGEGIMFISNKNDYIPFCIKHSNKTLIGFGLALNDRQKKNVRKEIDKLKDSVIPWYPRCVTDKNNGKKIKREDYINDYASLLVIDTKAKLFKFPKGIYKHYFVMTNNCATFADKIIGKTGSDILKINGIITPGTYYDYLNFEFKRRNSMVITKTIYNSKKEEIDKKKFHFASID